LNRPNSCDAGSSNSDARLSTVLYCKPRPRIIAWNVWITLCVWDLMFLQQELPYILEYNAHPVFGDFLNEKKLVRDSNAHLSFNHPLPTERLIE
jgi:hypothetical protein